MDSWWGVTDPIGCRVKHWSALRFLLCFFFSSRRRHTRLVSDWSSDVCSSDLVPIAGRVGGTDRLHLVEWADLGAAGLGGGDVIEQHRPLRIEAAAVHHEVAVGEIGRASGRERV